MTILDEGKQLRLEAAKLRPDRRRRYPDDLRRRILDWIDRAVAAGYTQAECGRLVRINTWRFTYWRKAPTTKVDARQAPTTTVDEHQEVHDAVALVPIEVTGFAPATRLSLVAPSGHRIDGLTLEQAASLLRELA